MAANPALTANGEPVPFASEMLLACRPSVHFEVEGLEGLPNSRWSARGRVFLSTLRLVCVAEEPTPPVTAFDIPLLYITEEKFNQPLFWPSNNLSGRVAAMLPGATPGSSHAFRIFFTEGGTGTFVPLFFSVLRRAQALAAPPPEATAAPPPPPGGSAFSDLVMNAYVDPNDPSKVFLQQGNH